jgi:hypothetical protein
MSDPNFYLSAGSTRRRRELDRPARRSRANIVRHKLNIAHCTYLWQMRAIGEPVLRAPVRASSSQRPRYRRQVTESLL